MEFISSPDYPRLNKKYSDSTKHSRSKYAWKIKKSTRITLSTMFSTYVKWLHNNEINLLNASANHIIQFLDTKRSTIRLRYISLLEKVYRYLDITPNPAADAYLKIATSSDVYACGVDKATIFLNREQETAFIRSLPGSSSNPSSIWKRFRDRTMMLTILGAGLSVTETLELKLNDIRLGFNGVSLRIYIAKSNKGSLLPREIALEDSYSVELKEWLDKRLSLNIPGDLIFPGNRTGRKLNRGTLFRQIKAAFLRAGLDDIDHQGGRTLRNTYAIRRLYLGTSLTEMHTSMGHRDLKTTEMFAQMSPLYAS